MDFDLSFPNQVLPSRSKGKKWRESCVDWAATKTYFNYSPVRNSVVHMKRNYDLLNGKIHMEDVAAILNPNGSSMAFLPEKIQHFPIINSKINTLRGEEAARVFDWHVVVVDPFSVNRASEEKKKELFARVQSIVESGDETDQQAADSLQEYMQTVKTWQDPREKRANILLRQYSVEQNFKQIFNNGFVDALANNIEIYSCGISGGEPYIRRLNPLKLRSFHSGYSDRIEDADVLIYEDYLSRGQILDEYYDDLSAADVKKLSDGLPDFSTGGPVGAAGNYDDSYAFIPSDRISGEAGIMIDASSGLGLVVDELAELDGGIGSTLIPYDTAGNIRVLRVWWKSVRKILQVKKYDPQTGEEIIDFYPETYIPDKAAGETATSMYVNEAWEGTKIGDDIYVRIRPCLVQHNKMSNPSECNFGIIGTIYNQNESRPYSLVDMMKPYSYLYDAIHAKLVDLIATNWGKILEIDTAFKPKDWEVEKWLYFAKVNKVLIKDSFNEGSKGAATGKLAGGMNNATKGYVDADWGQSIQNYMNMLEWIKTSMSDLVGINRQREGNTYSRETVGGIERAVLQSSYITDWLFLKHDDTKRRVLECFLDYAKAALRGRSKKFQYILPDGTQQLVEIDGDEFAESDYGLVVDNSENTQKLYQQIESIGQAGLQNGLDFSSLLKLYTSQSLSEKIRIIENSQQQAEARRQQELQQQQQLEQMKIQAQQQMQAAELQQKDLLNQRDNETKIRVAEINAQAEYLRLGIYEDQNNEQLRREEMEIDREKIEEGRRQFNAELELKTKELQQKKDIELKKIDTQKQVASATRQNNKK